MAAHFCAQLLYCSHSQLLQILWLQHHREERVVTRADVGPNQYDLIVQTSGDCGTIHIRAPCRY